MPMLFLRGSIAVDKPPDDAEPPFLAIVMQHTGIAQFWCLSWVVFLCVAELLLEAA